MLKQPIALLLACGKLGQRVGRDLQRAGYRVIAVRRTPLEMEAFEWLAVDLMQASVIEALPLDIDLLVYTPSPSRQLSVNHQSVHQQSVHQQQDSYQVMYAQLASQLVQHYQHSTSLKRALLISSTRVYEERGGDWVNEATPVQAASPQTQAVIDAENSWLKGFAGQACVLRLAGIYGPGREWQIRRLLAQQPIQYDPPTYTNRIHEQDAVRLMSFLLLQPSLPHALYIGVDGDPVAEGVLFAWLAQQLKMALPPALTPLELTPPGRLSSDSKATVKQNKRCHNARVKSLGFQFSYPSFREGYSEMLASYRSELGDL